MGVACPSNDIKTPVGMLMICSATPSRSASRDSAFSSRWAGRPAQCSDRARASSKSTRAFERLAGRWGEGVGG